MIESVREESFVSREQADQLVREFRPDLRLVRVWPMAGAVSSEVAGIEAQGADGVRCTLVLRQYGAANVGAMPHIADNEYRLLIARADVPFLPDVGDNVLEELGARPHIIDGVVPETAIRKVLQANWPPPQVSEPVVLHGDYWPGNVLWHDGRLVGVVDWEEAAFGDAMADLANIRLEIVWHFGSAATNMLTREYLARRPAAGTATLPVWDLRTALRACEFPLEKLPLPADEIASMRHVHREFAVAAMSRL